ncbi:MAG: hypothetical protein JO255_11430 [Alphaproteobacteria bacterium]|nr:hypothetical protein [Alphaproteobacteria bacterium]
MTERDLAGPDEAGEPDQDAAELRSLALPRGYSRFRRGVRAAAKYAMDFYVDAPVRFARLLYGVGLQAAAEKTLGLVHDALPCDLAAAERRGQMIYRSQEARFPLGSAERSCFLLHTMYRSLPSELLTSAYFANLEHFFKMRERRATPGQLVLGLGTTRSGSTTMTEILGSVEGALSTHEVPPLIYWRPLPEQVEFHLKRLEVLRWYFPLVVNCASYGLGMLDDFLERFPDGKIVAAHRATEPCARSNFRIIPPRSNRWAALHNGVWSATAWDPLFPKYPVPDGARANRDDVKRDHIRRYITEYNARLKSYAERLPSRFLLVRTEELDAWATRTRISEFLGMPITMESVRLNVRTIERWGETWF